MFTITQGEFELFEPGVEFAQELKIQIAKEVKKQYQPGEYKNDTQTLKSIVNLMVSEYNKLLEPALEQIACNEIIRASLWQYNETQKMVLSGVSGNGTEEQLQAAQVKTRAHKYLAERCLAVGREDALCTDKDAYIRHLARVLVCADQIVLLSTVSDQIANDVMVSDFKLIVPSTDDEIEINGNRTQYEDFCKRLVVSNTARDKIFSGRTIDVDENGLSNELEPAFSNEHLLRFGETLLLLAKIDHVSRGVEGSSFTTKLVDKAKIINFIKDYTREVSAPTDAQCNRLLAGVTVFPQKINSENRTFFNPQLPSRALKRCFFETTFDGRPHLAWVPELVYTAIEAIPKALVFGEFPDEWRSTEIDDRVAKISNKRGDWFEKEVAKAVAGIAICGFPSRTSIGRKKDLMPLTPEPGELDFIGWSAKDRAIIIFEGKMLKWAAEPRNVRNQNKQFTKPEGFIEKLEAKSEWVANNIEAVVKALNSEDLQVVDPISVNSAFISFEPLFAKYEVKNYPVVSIAEFIDDYSAAGKWPYTNGIKLLP